MVCNNVIKFLFDLCGACVGAMEHRSSQDLVTEGCF